MILYLDEAKNYRMEVLTCPLPVCFTLPGFLGYRSGRFQFSPTHPLLPVLLFLARALLLRSSQPSLTLKPLCISCQHQATGPLKLKHFALLFQGVQTALHLLQLLSVPPQPPHHSLRSSRNRTQVQPKKRRRRRWPRQLLRLLHNQFADFHTNKLMT